MKNQFNLSDIGFLLRILEKDKNLLKSLLFDALCAQFLASKALYLLIVYSQNMLIFSLHFEISMKSN